MKIIMKNLFLLTLTKNNMKNNLLLNNTFETKNTDNSHNTWFLPNQMEHFNNLLFKI